MYPTKVARRNEHTTAGAIFWLNLIFGVTIIFWIVLLIWASSMGIKNAPQQVVIQQPLEQAFQTDKNIGQLFAELAALKEQGFISEEEYERKRAELISRI